MTDHSLRLVTGANRSAAANASNDESSMLRPPPMALMTDSFAVQIERNREGSRSTAAASSGEKKRRASVVASRIRRACSMSMPTGVAEAMAMATRPPEWLTLNSTSRPSSAGLPFAPQLDGDHTLADLLQPVAQRGGTDHAALEGDVGGFVQPLDLGDRADFVESADDGIA